MAFMAVIMGLGLLFYIALGFGLYLLDTQVLGFGAIVTGLFGIPNP